MKALQIDERNVAGEGRGSNFVVFIYEGGDEPMRSWSVDSYLLSQCGLREVWAWLERHLPDNCCWSLGTVTSPRRPDADATLDIDWIVGADVLNAMPDRLDLNERRIAAEMLARRHRTTLD